MAVISGEQLRAARALLRWDQRHLAAAADISLETVKRLELTEGPVSAYTGTVEALRRALEEAGVMFVEADQHGGAGVRFSPQKALVPKEQVVAKERYGRPHEGRASEKGSQQKRGRRSRARVE